MVESTLPASLYRVEVSTSETISGRGVRRVAWFVQHADGWLEAHRYAGAEVVSVDAGPGTVWERRICLRLPGGHRLVRRETRPRPLTTRDPFEYLSREVRSLPLEVHETRFVVGSRGELRRLPSETP